MILKLGNINVKDRDVNKISDSNILVQKMVLNILLPAKIMKMLCIRLPKINRYDKYDNNFDNVNPKRLTISLKFLKPFRSYEEFLCLY